MVFTTSCVVSQSPLYFTLCFRSDVLLCSTFSLCIFAQPQGFTLHAESFLRRQLGGTAAYAGLMALPASAPGSALSTRPATAMSASTGTHSRPFIATPIITINSSDRIDIRVESFSHSLILVFVEHITIFKNTYGKFVFSPWCVLTSHLSLVACVCLLLFTQ
jgi:hypothetical protein